MFLYIGLFFICSFLGWILDTSYRSFIERKYSSGSFLPFLAPIYGFGGVLLTLLFQYTSLSIGFDILVGTMPVILLEFTGGVFCVLALKKKYWDYSYEKGNFLGYVDILHSCYWFLLVICFRLLFPFLALSLKIFPYF